MVKRTALQRWLIDPLEYALLRTLFGLLGLLSPVQASNLGGWVARTLGPRLPVSNRARRNLALALPELGASEHEAIVRAMWDNLGRVFAEMPHLDAIIASGRVTVDADQVAQMQAAKDAGQAILFVGAHLSNFEVCGRVAAHYGFPQAVIYRRANNPLVDDFFRQLRGPEQVLLPKGAEGFRDVRKVLADGGNLGMLIDQKLNEGAAIPFFGRDAMTTTAPAQMAARYKAALFVGRVMRLGPARYRVTSERIAPVEPAEASAKARREAVQATTVMLNGIIEQHIREQLGEWFWLHRRWPDSKGPWPDPSLTPSADHNSVNG